MPEVKSPLHPVTAYGRPIQREAFYHDGSRESAQALSNFIGRADIQLVTRDRWRVVFRDADTGALVNVEGGQWVLKDSVGVAYRVNRSEFERAYSLDPPADAEAEDDEGEGDEGGE